MTGKNSLPRIAFFDNAKAILIFLVVLGHALALISDQSRFSDALLNCIYLFHMPAFVFISGLFSKHSYTVNHGLNVNRIIGFLALYLLTYTGFWGIGQISNQGWEYNAFFTNSLAWYMLAMAWWTLLTPAALKLGEVPTLTFFLILSLIIGFYDDFGGFLVLSRAIVFVPFFFLGFFFDQNIAVEKLRQLHKSHLNEPLDGLNSIVAFCIVLATSLLLTLVLSWKPISVPFNKILRFEFVHQGTKASIRPTETES